MTFKKSFDCFDFYDRAKVGEKCTQDEWDLMRVPMKAMELKQKYGLDFKGEFIPTDKDMMENSSTQVLTCCLNAVSTVPTQKNCKVH